MKKNAIMKKSERDEWYLELALIVITIGMAFLMWRIAGYKLVILNLFYLPVVLAGFFLGRYRAGVLATLAVILASIVTSLNLSEFAAHNSPMIIGLSVTMWAAVLGLTSLLVGTLSDERTQMMSDLHEAHVGVVEVLARYLQSAHPKLKVRSQRVAELSQAVARELELTSRECDDIRVAALLHDMENIEITAKVIRKAVGDLESQPLSPEHSFHGSELAHSLGSVLTSALPLLLGQGEVDPLSQHGTIKEAPLGAKIIRTVRAYDRMLRQVDVTHGVWSRPARDVIDELRRDRAADYPERILDALELIVATEDSAHLVLAEAQ